MSEVSQKARSWLRKPSNWQLVVIIAGYILLVGLYSWMIPPFEGPDEPQHVAYIMWLADGKGFPPQGDAAWDTPVEQEASQSPLYYLLASIPARLINRSASPAVYRSNPHFVGVFPRIQADNDNRAIHYPSDARPLTGGWLALYMARALSLSFGILLLVSTNGLGRVIFPKRPQIALAATLLIAFTPQVIFISSVASNDIPAAALSASTMWLMAILMVRGPSRGRAIAVGVALGLAVLMKASALGLALPIVAGLAWLWLSKRHSLKQIVAIGIWMALGAFLIAGWWFIRSWILYGSPLGFETHDLTPWAIDDPERLARIDRRWHEVFRSFWLAIGWGTIRPKEWLYDFFLAFFVIALIGLAVAAWRWLQRPRPRPDTKPLLLMLLTLAILVVGLSLEMWMRRVIAPYGRLMFPALAAVAILLTTGWYSIDRKLPFIVGGLMLFLALLVPLWLIQPAYEPPVKLTQQETERLSPENGSLFGADPDQAIVELVSAKALVSSMEADRDLYVNLPVELCWRPIRPSDQPYTVLVHIIGPEDSVVANRRTYPGLGLYPTTTWEAGFAFCDLVRVPVWPDLARTLVYKIEVGLINQESGKRLPIFDANGNSVPILLIDDARLVTIEPKETFMLPDEDNGDPFQLIEYDLKSVWTPGESVDLTLEWGLNNPADEDYQVFVHLRDMESGKTVAQADGPPLGGWYPTSWWPVGEIINDARTFPLPINTPPGKYELLVGLYSLESGLRFGQEVNLGMIEVQP